MFWRIFLNILLIIGLTAWQLSFWQTLPWELCWLNIVLVIGVFVLIIFDFNWAVLWWLLPAWLLDLFGFGPFGLEIILASCGLLILYWLLINFFTNRSLYSTLFLLVLATLLHDLGSQLANSFLVGSLAQGFGNVGWWLIESRKVGANLILGLIFFYLFNFLSFRFQPVFLKK